MRVKAFLGAAFVLCATTAFAQTVERVAQVPTVPRLSLEIAVRGYAGDERARAMAGDSAPDKIESYVWADKSFCSMGAAPTMPSSTTPWVGWHFIGTVQNQNPDTGRGAIQFKIEWQRIWENGARVAESGTKGISETSLRDGERLVLDRVNGGGTETCGATQVRLEVGVISQPPYRVGFFSGGRGAATTATGARAGAGGRGAAGVTGTTNGTTSRGTAGAGGRGANATGMTVFTPKTAASADFVKMADTLKAKRLVAQPGSYDAELWLVHRHPDGKETTQQQTVRFTGADQTFTFPNIVVATSKGDISLDVSGTLKAVVGNDPNAQSKFATFSNGLHSFDFNKTTTTTVDNAIRLAVSISRRARAAGTPPLDTRGGSNFFMDVPAPADVVSFEFPSLQKATEDLLKGHTFSLRIQVKPVAR